MMKYEKSLILLFLPSTVVDRLKRLFQQVEPNEVYLSPYFYICIPCKSIVF